MGASGNVALLQPVGEREPEGIRQERDEDDDLSGRHPLFIHQFGNLVGDPVEHLRVVAVVFVAEGGAHAFRRRLLLAAQTAGQLVAKGPQFGRGDEGLGEGDPLLAQVSEGIAALWIGAQETTVAPVLIIDEQGRPAVGYPLPQQVVGHRRVLFDVVHNEVSVGLQQVVAAQRQAP